jgi:2-isopropylmalate synthase
MRQLARDLWMPVYKAINRVVNVPNELIEFSVQSVTAGIDAIGEVTIRLRQNDRIFAGHSANTDIIVASAQAYVNALKSSLRFNAASG